MFKKRMASLLLAVTLAVAVLLSGCSTPAVAAVIDGEEFSSGDYLAYLYSAYEFTLTNDSNIYYAAYMGQDIWNLTYKYGEEEDNQITMKLGDYLVQMTQDSMVRVAAVKNLMDEYKLVVDAEKLKELNDQIDSLTEADLIKMGFNRETFRRMNIATGLYEDTLFYGLYDKGGIKAVSEADIRKYFDENYLSYKVIEFSLMDSKGAEINEDEKAKIKKRLEEYKALYEQYAETSTPSEAFDKVIKKYKEDEAAASTTTGTGTGTTTSATTTTPTTAATTTAPTTTATTTAPTTSGTGTTAPTTEEPKTEEETTDANRKDIDANLYGDEDLANAIKKVTVGGVDIVTYEKGGTTSYMALFLRLDPEEGKKETYFEDCRKDILYGARYDEYDEMVKTAVTKIEFSFDPNAVRLCRPENFAKVK